jgi:hypothetical protein
VINVLVVSVLLGVVLPLLGVVEVAINVGVVT